MRSFNQITLYGTIGGDSKIKTFPNGDHCATASMVTNISWKDKATGEWKEKGIWHNIQASRKLADYLEKEGRKGRAIFVVGMQMHEDWAKPDGTHGYFSFVRADEIQIWDRPKKAEREDHEQTPADDDIPF